MVKNSIAADGRKYKKIKQTQTVENKIEKPDRAELTKQHAMTYQRRTKKT